MASIGSILVADDEETFRESISRLLRREGFDCRCAKDAEEAVESLRRGQFDLLLADIRMPRNPDLRLVREALELDSQMPVILVTGYPSMETAIRCVEMSVVAYLTKPLDFDELLPWVRTAVEHSRKRRVLSAVRQRLSSCLSDLEAVQSKRLPREGETDELVSIATIRTLASSLSELLELAARSGICRGAQNLCELLDCPQQPLHRRAIIGTIEVLKKTKDTFKSKALASLRMELEGLVGSSAGFCCRE